MSLMDLNPGMLKMAKDRLSGAGYTGRIKAVSVGRVCAATGHRSVAYQGEKGDRHGKYVGTNFDSPNTSE